MSTRCAIGYIENGYIKGIYCHFDGYPSFAGKILYNHYDLNKTKELISLGYLSQLGEHIGEKHDFQNCPENTCNFYGRDREEKNVGYIEFNNKEQFVRCFKDSGCKYFYLLENNIWMISKDGITFEELNELYLIENND